MKIEARKLDGSHQLSIYVDDRLWARLYKESRGPHGYFYEVYDTGQRLILQPNTKRTPWRIWSDKQAARQAGLGAYSADKIIPLNQRIIHDVAEMIKVGALRSPEQVTLAAEVEKRRRAEDARKQQEYTERRLSDKADEVLGTFNDGRGLDAHRDEVKQRVIDAMKWAQTQ